MSRKAHGDRVAFFLPRPAHSAGVNIPKATLKLSFCRSDFGDRLPIQVGHIAEALLSQESVVLSSVQPQAAAKSRCARMPHYPPLDCGMPREHRLFVAHKCSLLPSHDDSLSQLSIDFSVNLVIEQDGSKTERQ